MTDSKFADIETALAHHDRQIEELSDVISAQWQEIERLKRYIQKTEAQLEDYIAAAGENQNLSTADIAARDKPPHY